MPLEFPPAFELKLRFTNKDSEDSKQGWIGFFKVFWGKKTARVFVYLALVMVILNFWLFRYDDFANGCHIKIPLSITELNNLQIKEGIKLLKEKSPVDYQELCSSVKSISPELACGGMGGGCYH